MPRKSSGREASLSCAALSALRFARKIDPIENRKATTDIATDRARTNALSHLAHMRVNVLGGYNSGSLNRSRVNPAMGHVTPPKNDRARLCRLLGANFDEAFFARHL
jgi:hypothetical protein